MAFPVPRACTWCGEEIVSRLDRFGLRARIRSGVDLSVAEGGLIPISIIHLGKDISALVARQLDSPEEEGLDLVFFTCSQDCARKLRQVLEAERALFSTVQTG